MDAELEFEERDKRKKRYMLQVVIAEFIMVLSVILIATVAVLFSMGFFLSEEGKIERSGLVQLHSFPTGATVTIDGATLFSRTNLSRTLSEGTHHVSLTRSGFDTWSGNVKISSGLLLRTFYPRIFTLNRTAIETVEIPTDLEFYTASGARNYILYAENDSTTWSLLDISSDEPRISTLDLAEFLPGVEDNKFIGQILETIWSRSNDKLLVKVRVDNQTSWLWIDLRDITRSVNITSTYGLDFSNFRMANDSGTIMYALENNNIRRINISTGDVSRVLISNVESFDSVGDDILYVTIPQAINNSEEQQKTIAVYKYGEEGSTTLKTVTGDTNVLLDLMIYFDASYFTLVTDNQILVFYGSIPSYTSRIAEQTESTEGKYRISTGAEFDILLNEECAFSPNTLNAYSNGEFIILSNNQDFAAIDLEHNYIEYYTSVTAQITWLESGILTSTTSNNLKIWDFNNANQRTLVRYSGADKESNGSTSSVTTTSKYPLANYTPIITSNGRWLYYVAQGSDSQILIKERLL